MDYKIGDVVQLGPKTKNKIFAYCFMTITELKDFGAQGYVQSVGENRENGGQAYYRASFEEMEFIGRARWTVNQPKKDI